MNSLVIGRRGLGKRPLGEFLAREDNDDLIVFDPNNQFRDALLRTSDIAELEDELESQDGNLDNGGFYVAYVPIGNVEEEWNRFAAAIWEYGDYALIIDEAHRLQKPNYVNEWLDRFVRQAPRRERNDDDPIEIVMTAHRMVDIRAT